MAVTANILKRIINSKNKLILRRTIMSSAARAQKFAEELEQNPYFEKYASKIAQLQLTSPEEFLNRAAEQDRKNETLKQKVKESTEKRKFTSLLKPKDKIEVCQDTQAQSDSLEAIMKIELIKDKSVDEIKEIWLKYHLQKDVIAALIPAEEYNTMMKQAETTPTFIFPLPRSQGYEFIMSQFQKNSIHFTPLICYQVHRENAPECLTIKNYTEFKDSKGIVLMRGEFDKEVLNSKEAQCLANQFQLYYNHKDKEKLELMNMFTNEPDKFKHMDLIKQIECLQL